MARQDHNYGGRSTEGAERATFRQLNIIFSLSTIGAIWVIHNLVVCTGKEKFNYLRDVIILTEYCSYLTSGMWPLKFPLS